MEKIRRKCKQKQIWSILPWRKNPLEFASEFHERMLGRIKEMLDPYREQIAHDRLMKR